MTDLAQQPDPDSTSKRATPGLEKRWDPPGSAYGLEPPGPECGPNDWYSAEAEAANCRRILGDRRHGMDSMLPENRKKRRDTEQK